MWQKLTLITSKTDNYVQMLNETLINEKNYQSEIVAVYDISDFPFAYA